MTESLPNPTYHTNTNTIVKENTAPETTSPAVDGSAATARSTAGPVGRWSPRGPRRRRLSRNCAVDGRTCETMVATEALADLRGRRQDLWDDGRREGNWAGHWDYRLARKNSRSSASPRAIWADRRTFPLTTTMPMMLHTSSMSIGRAF